MLLYGNDIQSLETAVEKEKSKYPESLRLTPPFSYQVMEEQLSHTDLFGTNRLFIIENFFHLGLVRAKPTKPMEALIGLVKQAVEHLPVLFIEPEEKRVKYYKTFIKDSVSQGFVLPKYLFTFLDAIKPGGLKITHALYENALQENAAELLFYFMKRRVRDLINAQAGTFGNSTAPWQRGKLSQQAKTWKPEKLVQFYKALFTIEEGIKGGRVPYDTKQGLSLVLNFYL